jgi:hypothetical protein
MFKDTHLAIHALIIMVVCVCVERERERERLRQPELERWLLSSSFLEE